jgi:hypothetical protein
MQCACAILLSVFCPAVQYFSRLSHKQQDFQIIFLDILYKFCLDISHSKTNGWIQDQTFYIRVHVKYPFFLSDFNET